MTGSLLRIAWQTGFRSFDFRLVTVVEGLKSGR